MLLKDIRYYHYIALSNYLDRETAGGNNYKMIATMYGFTNIDVDHFAKSYYYGKLPTEMLLYSMNMRYPELTVESFRDKCRDIYRIDIVNYIDQNILPDNNI